MRKTITQKSFDCVEMKRRIQAEIYKKIKGMSPEEEIAYFQSRMLSGPSAEWYRKARRHPFSRGNRTRSARQG